MIASVAGNSGWRGLSPRWLYASLIVQFVTVGALVIEEVGVFRFVFRFLAFASSLMMLATLLLPTNPAVHGYTLRTIAYAFLAVLFIGFLHPALNGPLVGIAQIGLNLAILAPLFWVPHIAVDTTVLRRAILMVWGFYTLSAIVGVLQVYYPERFMPDPRFIRQLVGDEVAESLKIQLDDGQTLYRPMGLSDTPGGAGPAGLSAFITGLALAVTDRVLLIRVLGVIGAAIGIFCVYISQVRTSLIVAGIDLLAFMLIQGLRGKLDRAAGLLIFGATIFSVGFVWVMSIGSMAVGSRLETLTQDSAVNVYRANRGYFLVETFESYLPQYPFGAGLGRYGMMFNYFGDRSNPDSPPLWAEIQWTAWVFDGGLPLLLLGVGGVFLAIFNSARIALAAADSVLADMAAIITTLNIGVFAQTFGSIPFSGQTGLMFWLLNAALFVASVYRKPRRAILVARLAPAIPRMTW